MAQIDGINTPPRGVLAQYMVLKIAERLPEVSGALLVAAGAGEPYEMLVRQLRVLHLQLEELAGLAKRAQATQGSAFEMPHANNKDSTLKTPVDNTFHGTVGQQCEVR